jgi:uncharacterized protein (DUF58 family)
VNRVPSPKLGAYAGLSALGLLAAVALGRPELVALAAPFLLVLGVGLAADRAPRFRTWLEVDRERVLEGDEVELTLTMRSDIPVGRVEIHLVLGPGLEVDDGRNPFGLSLGYEDETERVIKLRCVRWGGYAVGLLQLRVRGRLGLFTYEQAIDLRRTLRVYPLPETIQVLPPPFETQALAGNQVARSKGEGIEFADLRPFTAGDRVRRINWRASARRGGLVVNEQHPERNTDVVIFLDTFSEARTGDESTLDLAVRAAASISAHYLRRKDRVGLVSFGGVLSWLLPEGGYVQQYRIVDALISTEIVFSYAWKDVDVLPRRLLPAHALVPLLDERSMGALADLRARGFDLAVVEISPLKHVAAGPEETDLLAHRIWRLRREAIRAEYARLGVPVVDWHGDTPLAGALEEVSAFRRHASSRARV